MLKELLTKETSTMVLVSLMYSFTEICPERLDMLHGCYRKLCHLLTDMDEWGQVIVMDVLSRYCRSYFAKPINVVGGGEVLGSAEIIDRQRRVVRKLNKDGHGISTGEDIANEQEDDDETQNVLLPPVKSAGKAAVVKKSKRRVVKKAFYSDEEDESSDEDLIPQAAILASKNHSVASSMRQRNVLGFGDGISGVDGNYGPNGVGGVADATGAVDEDSELDEDHRLLLRSSLPLLKSRNSAVVLGVCSLHYYCGVASIKIRSALGKALVRIYHDRREIQFVVLNSIRMLVWECPSAFTPFLNNFFVKAMDPSFTRLIKLDILSALALEPNSINAVLNELRVYIRHDDKDFVCAAVQAVGKIVEMAQIIYDRQGAKTGNIKAMKKESNVIALNCLHGILTLMESSSHAVVVGECINVTQRILLLLKSSASEDQTNVVLDPSHVQFMSLRRLVLLVVSSLTSQSNAEVDEDEDLDSNGEMNSFKEQIISLPTQSIGPALWIIGDHLCVDDNVNLLRVSGQEKKLILSELLRIMAKMFQDMSPYLKCHCIHFASKTIISNHTARNGQYQDRSLCEYILALGRTDINQDVRDRSRNESLVIHISVGIQYDVETLPPLPMNGAKITMENAKSMLLQNKPSSSWLPLDDINGVTSPFRFGTLSSMVSHKAGRNYMSLPDWAEFNSPKTLRDQPQDKVEVKKKESKKKRDMFDKTKKSTNGFYDSDSSTSSDDDESTSESSSSSSESESSSSSESESSSSSDDTVSDESTSSEEDPETLQPQKHILPIESNVVPSVIEPMKSIVDSSDEDSSSDDNSSSSDESTVDSEANGKEPVTRHAKVETNPMSSLLDMNFNGGEIVAKHKNIEKVTKKHVDDAKNASTDSIVTGLEGLVMAPLKIDKKKLSSINIEEECSDWIVLVRPDLSGGLSVTSRFLRNGVRKRELLLLGLEPKKSSVICIQMKFENK
jgi:AP-3 complex subunit beta